MIVVQGSVRVRAEDVERVRATAAWYVPATREEPGCLHYAFSHDMLDPTLLHLIERWEDEESLVAHLRTPHVARLNDFMKKIPLADVVVRSYEAKDENALMGE